MDIVLRRCSPPTKQPAHRGRPHIVSAAETSLRPAEAALEPDASPHDATHDGDGIYQNNDNQTQDLLFGSGDAAILLSKLRPTPVELRPETMGTMHVGNTPRSKLLQQQWHSGDHDEMDAEVGPGDSTFIDGQSHLEWHLCHQDPRNVGRIQQLLIQQQQWMQRLANGSMSSMQAAECGANARMVRSQTAHAGEPMFQHQVGHGADPQDVRDVSDLWDREQRPLAEPSADLPQRRPVGQPQVLYLKQRARASKNAAQPERHTADLGEPVKPQPPYPPEAAGMAGGGGGGRGKSAGKERSSEQRPQAGDGSGGAGMVRRGRKSTVEELFQAANALELLMNSGPGEAVEMNAAGATGAAEAISAGLNGGIGRIIAGNRAGGSAGFPTAGTRGDPLASGSGAMGQGRMGSGGRRGGGAGAGGRGTRIGGNGPRIIRGTMPEPELMNNGAENADVDGGSRRLGGAGEPRRDAWDSLNRGSLRSGGGRGRPGAGRYGQAENDDGGESDEEIAAPVRRNGVYRGDRRPEAAFDGGFYGGFPEDETMFGPIPRRPRTSVYCSPMLYDEIVTGVNPPASEVQVLSLSWSDFVRMVHRQRAREQQQGRGLAGWHPAATAGMQMHRAHLQPQQHRAAQQLPNPLCPLQAQQLSFAIAPLHPAAMLGAVGSLSPAAFSQELLRRALLIQEEQHQQEGIPAAEWDVPRGDARYGSTGGAAQPPGRRPGQGPRRTRAAAGAAAGEWPGASSGFLPVHGDLGVLEDLGGDLPPVQHAQPLYDELYDEAAAVTMAAAAAQHQELLERLSMLGVDGLGDGFPGGLGLALGSGEHMLGYGNAGQLMDFREQQEQHDAEQLPPEVLGADVSTEVPASRKRRARPGKGRPTFDLPSAADGAAALRDSGGGAGGRGSKRAWSPLDDGIVGAAPYVSARGPQPPGFGYDGRVADLDPEEDLGAGGHPSGSSQRMRHGAPCDTSAVIATQSGRGAVGRGSSGGAPPTGTSGGAGRQRTGSAKTRRGSIGNMPESDVEDVPPSTERAAAGGAGLPRSARGGSGGGGVSKQSRHGGDADNADGGKYGPYSRLSVGLPDHYYVPFDRDDSPGAGGMIPVPSAAPPASKRSRQVDGGPINGRSGSATGPRARGRNTSPSGGPAPSSLGPGLPSAKNKGTVANAPDAAERQRLLELTYTPFLELHDVQEQKGGQELSLTFSHSTLGAFTGRLTLVTAE